MFSYSTHKVKSQNENKSQKKSKRIFAREEKHVSIQKEEKKSDTSTSLKANEASGSANLKNLQDFPELKMSLNGEKFLADGKKNRHFAKSWTSVVNSVGNTNICNESFPKLPNSKNYNKSETSLPKTNTSQEKPTQRENQETNTSEPKDFKSGGKKNVKNKTTTIKKTGNQPQKNPHKKKKNDPIFFNFSDALDGDKVKSKRRQPKFLANKVRRTKEKDVVYGNILDSAKPKLFRGKHREIKKKKFTRLKLAIIKERILKQKISEKALANYFWKECEDLYSQINFKVEIKNYVNDLNERKINYKKTNKTEKKNEVKNEGKVEVKNISKVIKENGIKNEEKKALEVTNTSNSTTGNLFTFSSKLREYCDNVITPSLNLAVSEFIWAIVNLQDKFFARDPIKAKVRKRHVSGLKEVRQHLVLNKVKLIIMAPDLEKLRMEGSVFDMINELKSIAKEQNVPYVFALGRYKLGRWARKNVPVSAFACLNYDGVESLYDNVIKESNEAKIKFMELQPTENTTKIKGEKEKDVSTEVISSFIEAFRNALQVVNKEEKDSN